MGVKKCPNENDDRNDDYKSGHHHGQSPCQHQLNEKLRQTCLSKKFERKIKSQVRQRQLEPVNGKKVHDQLGFIH